MGRHAVADHRPTDCRERDEDRVCGVGGRGAGGEDHVRPVRPVQEAPERAFRGGGVVRNVREPDQRRAEPLDLGRQRGLEARPAGGGQGLLHDCRDPTCVVRTDVDDGSAPGSDRLASRQIGRRDEVRTRLDACHQRTRGHELPVEQREDAEPVDPVQSLEGSHPDAEGTRSHGVQVDPRLVRSANLEARTGDGAGQDDRGVILVNVAGLGNQERHWTRLACPWTQPVDIAGGQEIEVRRRQAPALRPALARNRQVAGEHRTGEQRRWLRQWRPRHDRDELHALSVARRATIACPYPRRARAASMARRV